MHHHRFGLIRFFLSAALLALSALSAVPVRAAAAGPAAELKRALLLADTAGPAELLALADAVRQAGAVPLATFPNQGMLIQLDPALLGVVRGLPGVRLLSLEPVALEDAGADPGARDAARVWNQMFSDALQSPPAGENLPPLPDNDARRAPPAQMDGQPDLHTPLTYWQTSEFMLYTVNVDVFLVESDGSSPSNDENWTTTQRDQVQAEIASGLAWWVTTATTGGNPSAYLSFNINYHTPWNDAAVVSTTDEPIKETSNNEGTWIGQVMNHLGYNSGSYFSNVARYNHDRRIAMGTDWAISIFVANSALDADGLFSDGYFGYAYLNGPFMVMTYDNDGWGIGNMEMVTAHENSHLFGGLDEYASSGCSDTEIGGYLGIANTNCENGTPATENSIMRSSGNQMVAYPAHSVSTPVRGMVGWRDSDADGLYDPIDTTPSLTLSASGTVNLATTTTTLSGSASNTGYPSPTSTTADINYIQAVQYRIAGGGWTACSAADGAFDESIESYQCAVSGLAQGSNLVEARALNRSQISSAAPFPSVTLVVDSTPPLNPAAANPHCAALDNAWQNTCANTNFTWSAGSDAGSGVNGYYYYWGSDPAGTSVSYTISAAYDPPAAGAGTTYLRLQTRDNAGNTSAWATVFTLRYETTAPSGSLSIASGAAYAPARGVPLGLSASDTGGSGLAQMRFSNDGSTWSDWEAYAAARNWTLSAGDGPKTVYAQFSDGAGNLSADASDTITLDSTPPAVSAGSPWMGLDGMVHFDWSSVENGIGGVTYIVEYRLGAEGAWTAWLDGVTQESGELGPFSRAALVYFRVRAGDALGNTSAYVESAASDSNFNLIFLPVLLK